MKRENNTENINECFKIDDEMKEICRGRTIDRLIYYFHFPSYFFHKLWQSIETFTWKL